MARKPVYRSIGIVPQKKAQVVGECLESLPDRTTKSVLAEARKKTSPLHDLFEWDPVKAHGKYLADRAYQVIRSIQVVVTGSQSVKAFHNVSVQDEPGENRRFYAHVDTVSMIDDMRDQVLKRALSEIDAWQRRYANYESSFRAIFEAIASTRGELKRDVVTGATRNASRT